MTSEISVAQMYRCENSTSCSIKSEMECFEYQLEKKIKDGLQPKSSSANKVAAFAKKEALEGGLYALINYFSGGTALAGAVFSLSNTIILKGIVFSTSKFSGEKLEEMPTKKMYKRALLNTTIKAAGSIALSIFANTLGQELTKTTLGLSLTGTASGAAISFIILASLNFSSKLHHDAIHLKKDSEATLKHLDPESKQAKNLSLKLQAISCTNNQDMLITSLKELAKAKIEAETSNALNISSQPTAA